MDRALSRPMLPVLPPLRTFLAHPAMRDRACSGIYQSASTSSLDSFRPRWVVFRTSFIASMVRPATISARTCRSISGGSVAGGVICGFLEPGTEVGREVGEEPPKSRSPLRDERTMHAINVRRISPMTIRIGTERTSLLLLQGCH